MSKMKSKDVKTVNIVVPTITCYDLLNPLIESIKCSRPVKIMIIDNGEGFDGLYNPNPDKISIMKRKPQNNLGVAGSWNLGLRKIFQEKENEYAIVMNDDIEFMEKLDNILSTVESNPEYGVYLSQENWAFFVIRRETFIEVGEFDEEFYPGYFEDDDYEYRLFLAKKRIYRIEAKINHVGSESIRRFPSLNSQFLNNQGRYVEKWGGLPRNEEFKTPYGLKKVPLTYVKQYAKEK